VNKLVVLLEKERECGGCKLWIKYGDPCDWGKCNLFVGEMAIETHRLHGCEDWQSKGAEIQ
jgi:hypothetical protein